MSGIKMPVYREYQPKQTRYNNKLYGRKDNRLQPTRNPPKPVEKRKRVYRPMKGFRKLEKCYLHPLGPEYKVKEYHTTYYKPQSGPKYRQLSLHWIHFDNSWRRYTLKGEYELNDHNYWYALPQPQGMKPGLSTASMPSLRHTKVAPLSPSPSLQPNERYYFEEDAHDGEPDESEKVSATPLAPLYVAAATSQKALTPVPPSPTPLQSSPPPAPRSATSPSLVVPIAVAAVAGAAAGAAVGATVATASTLKHQPAATPPQVQAPASVSDNNKASTQSAVPATDSSSVVTSAAVGTAAAIATAAATAVSKANQPKTTKPLKSSSPTPAPAIVTPAVTAAVVGVTAATATVTAASSTNSNIGPPKKDKPHKSKPPKHAAKDPATASGPAVTAPSSQSALPTTTAPGPKQGALGSISRSLGIFG